MSERFRTPAQKQKAAKIDRAALHMAEMWRGTYEREGYKLRQNQNGEWIPSVSEALTRAGFARTYKILLGQCTQGEGKFGSYFREREAFHRRMLEGGYKRELAKLTNEGVDLFRLRALTFQSLLYDLADEERAASIPFKERAALYSQVTKLEAEAGAGDKPTDKNLRQTVFNTIVLGINDPIARQRMLDKMSAKEAEFTLEAHDIQVMSELEEDEDDDEDEETV